MRFAFVISCIILLLGFIVGSTLTASQFSNHRCDKANWWASLDRNTWSVCPETNIYLRGFWRSAFKKRDERVGRLQEGRCCDAVLPEYAGQPATCSEVDLSDKLNRYNVWALCPSGYFMNGLRLGYAAPALLYNIDEAKCCHPQNHPKSDGYCYEENVTISFKKKGWSECQGEGFYMTGFYKSSCDELYCIEKFRCCKMKSELSAAPQNVKGTSISSTSILVTWDEVPAADRNGIILTYTITYRLPTEGQNASVTVKAIEFQKELTGLKEHANYSITVFSTNQIGDGPPSKPIFVTTSQYKKDEQTSQTSEVSFQFIWGSVGAFAIYVCAVLIAIAMKRIRWKRKDSLVEERNDKDNVTMLEITPDIMNQLRDRRQRNPLETQAEVPNSVADAVVLVDNETYLDQMEIERNWEIPPERLEILETELGGGEFGIVKKGNYLRGDGIKLPVAVKMLKDDSDQKQRMALIQELEMLRKVGRHKNIVSLVGACSFEEPLCVIVEFVPGGSLDRILLESRIPTRAKDTTYENLWSRLSERDLLRIAKDVANGMQHLESKLCVHRDLAARNVLIGKGLVAKVSDLGMSRDISQDRKYIKRTEGRVPWLWMSMESLRGINTTMSDVWSFGVVLWEIVTLGKRPYAGVTGIVELYTTLLDGFRLEKPPHCSEIMYDIMLQCWQETPEDRPTFKDLHSKLHSILCEPASTCIAISYSSIRTPGGSCIIARSGKRSHREDWADKIIETLESWAEIFKTRTYSKATDWDLKSFDLII
ncbi:Angiopoietin-1 receptor [Stylophora pistillata]|uniref:receptor protein-tyrosine kinase n=1 Tax=Stylophora pistillata TaxID=50429 RepID=A0A2B4RTE0_STYPI|nr:Angiopoietin-1 receptor [Stylophora pistillata]